ncbi:class F sortase [Streptomyces sp. NPDC059396]|uniref:class F sortase n=1 Tax=Streptomyces sp. NPDC059396 TaxID=3346819 RepID=UPI0036A3949A
MGNGSKPVKPVTPPVPSSSKAFGNTGSSHGDTDTDTRSSNRETDPGPGPGSSHGHRDSDAARLVTPATAPLSSAAPVALRIPEIEVDAPLLGVGLGRDGSMDVPPPGIRNVAGWYKDGPSPGAKGTAVIAGHADSARGPAVFHKLGALRKGHRIEVTRADGRTAVFSVDGLEVYENADFPKRKVYESAGRPELRVITCGGGSSKTTGYKSNTVASAHLTGVK